jgi:hypothetical protein
MWQNADVLGAVPTLQLLEVVPNLIAIDGDVAVHKLGEVQLIRDVRVVLQVPTEALPVRQQMREHRAATQDTGLATSKPTDTHNDPPTLQAELDCQSDRADNYNNRLSNTTPIANTIL